MALSFPERFRPPALDRKTFNLDPLNLNPLNLNDVRFDPRSFDPGALDPRVEPRDVHELRAVLVRALRDRADQVLLAWLAADRDDLPLLDVGAEADGEVGEAGDRCRVHAGAPI